MNQQGPVVNARHGCPGGFMHRSEPFLGLQKRASSGGAVRKTLATEARQGRTLGPLPPPVSEPRAAAGDERAGSAWAGSPARALKIAADHRARPQTAHYDGNQDASYDSLLGVRRNKEGGGPQYSTSPQRQTDLGCTKGGRENGRSRGAPLDYHGPDYHPRSPWTVVEPHSQERNRSPSSSMERTLESFRPAFRTDWLMALRREILEGARAENLLQRRDMAQTVADIREEFSTAIQQMHDDLESRFDKFSALVREDLTEALELDAAREKPITTFGRRLVDVDFGPMKDEVRACSLEVTNTLREDFTRAVNEAAGAERTAAVQQAAECKICLDKVLDALVSVGTKLDHTVELTRTVDLHPVLDAISNIPTVDLDPGFDRVLRGLAGIRTQIESTVEFTKTVDLHPILDAVSRIDVQPVVDLDAVIEKVDGINIESILDALAKMDAKPLPAPLAPDFSPLLAALEHQSSALKSVSDGVVVANQTISALDVDSIGRDLRDQLTSVAALAEASHAVIGQINPDDIMSFLRSLTTDSKSTLETIQNLGVSVKTSLPDTIKQETAGIVSKVQASTSLGSLTLSLKKIETALDEVKNSAVHTSTMKEALDMHSRSLVAPLELVEKSNAQMLELLKNQVSKTEVDALRQAINRIDLKSVLDVLGRMDSKHADDLKLMQDSIAETDTKLFQGLGQLSHAVGCIDVRPIVDLTEVLLAVEKIDFGPVLDGIGKIYAKPDVDLNPIHECLERGYMAQEDANVKISDAFAGLRHDLEALRVLSERQPTADMVIQMDAKREQQLVRLDGVLQSTVTAVRNIEDKPDMDLSPILVAIANVDVKSVLDRVDDAHTSTLEHLKTDSAEILHRIQSLHEMTNSIDLNIVLEAISNADSSRAVVSIEEQLQTLMEFDSQRMATYQDILEAIGQIDLSPLAARIENINHKLPQLIQPLLDEDRKLSGMCGAILSKLNSQQTQKGVLWATPSSMW